MIIIKTGLVLEGGGTKGAYHIGAYKALMEKGIEIDGITGTSIGALNGAMLVQGDYDRCKELWENISYDQVINLGDKNPEDLKDLDFTVDNLLSVGEQIKNLIANKGFDISPLKELLSEYIDEDKVRASGMDFGLVTVNVSDMEALELFKEDIPYGDLKKMLLASAYLPGFKTERLNGKYYLDGAFYDNLPFSMLEKKGYDKFILVRTHGPGLINRKEKDKLDALIIRPSQNLGKGHDYSSDRSRRNMKMGYYDTIRILDDLKGSIYTIKNDISEEAYLDFILSLSDNKLDELKKLFKLEGMPRKRAMFEVIIPRLASELNIDRVGNYSDIIIGLLERQAKYLGIDEFKIYGFEELYRLVAKNHIPIEYEELGPIEYIIEKSDLSTIFNMDKLILKVGEIIFREEEVFLLE